MNQQMSSFMAVQQKLLEKYLFVGLYFLCINVVFMKVYIRHCFIEVLLSLKSFKRSSRLTFDLVCFTTQVPDTSDTNAIRMKNFDFDNDTSEKIFSHPYIYYIAGERLQTEEQFHSKYLLEMLCSDDKMRLKSAPQKLTFVMVKAISKSYILDCSCKYTCTFPHNYAQ